MPRIVGSVKTAAGDHVMISVYVTPKPNPVGSNHPVTDLLVGGYVTQNTTQPVSIDLEPGTYDVRITGPGGVIVEKEIGLAADQEMSLSALVGATPIVPPPAAPVVNVNVTRPEIHVVASKSEAEALPDGSYYFLIEHATTTPTLIDHVAGQYTGDTGTVTPGGQGGDRVVVALNVKAQSDQTFTWPAGWTVLVEPYWVGTQQSTIAYGPWAQVVELKTAKAVEAGYVALSVRGGGTPTAGSTKDRTKDPKETTTVTAPKTTGTGRVFAYAFERSLGEETRSQITLSADWARVDFAAQTGSNLQTVAVAQGKGDTDATFTYPNAQATNGLGVQVVIPGA